MEHSFYSVKGQLTINPFSVNRWETETLHRIWVPPDVSVAADVKACFISGLRGTGKTVFLNCLDILAPLNSNYQFINKEELPRLCIGVYINILFEFTHYLYVLDTLGSKNGEKGLSLSSSHAHAFQTYLVFHSLGRTFGVIDDCRRAGVLEYSTYKENAFVADFEKLWRVNFPDVNTGVSPKTLLDCGALMNRVCMGIRVNSMRLYSERIGALIEAVQPISFYQQICRLLVKYGLLLTSKGEFHVKICLDDTHRVSPSDQRLINSILAVNSAPIGWNVSFVTGGYDAHSTLDPKVPLTDHDVNRIDLDYEEDHKGFKKLCSRMYNIRVNGGIRYSSEADYDNKEYWHVLGRPNAAILFSHLLSRTEKNSIRLKVNESLDYVAECLRSAGVGLNSSRQGHSDVRRYLPQAYVFVVLFACNKRSFENFLSQRTARQVDNYFRQKNVAALICAANETGAEVPYAGINMLVSLADGCVRDFLRILSILYNNVVTGKNRNLSKMASDRSSLFAPNSKEQIDIGEQSRSFIEASRQYVDHLVPVDDRTGRILMNLVLSIGALQKLLQSKDPVKALTTPERGLIEFDFSESTLLPDKEQRELILRQVLTSGQYIGVVRVMKGNLSSAVAGHQGSKVVFRLHHLTAPAFNVSARGPVHLVSVPLNSMLEFTEDQMPNPQSWAQRVFDLINDQNAIPMLSATKQAELFESE